MPSDEENNAAIKAGLSAGSESGGAAGSALMPELCSKFVERCSDLAAEVASLKYLIARLTEARLDPSAWISKADIDRSLAIYYESKAAPSQAQNVAISDERDKAP